MLNTKKIFLSIAILCSLQTFATSAPEESTYTCLDKHGLEEAGVVTIKFISRDSNLLTLELANKKYSNMISSNGSVILDLLYDTEKDFSKRVASHADVEIRGVVSDDNETLYINYELDPFISLREIARDLGISKPTRAICHLKKD